MDRRESYDLVIIGAGITGLSTGIAYKKIFPGKEHRVLVIEKQPVVGGCVSSFAREGFRFDTVQIIPDVSDILGFFNIELELKRFETNYTRLFLANPLTRRSEIFPVASGSSEFEKYLIGHFPEDTQKIQSFFRYCDAMHHELNYLKTEPGIFDVVKILLNCRRILANSGKTYKEFLDGFRFHNQKLVEVLDIFSSFSGLSGNRCAALLTASAMMATLKGSYRPKKGFIEFPQHLKREFENRGGKVLLRTSVEKIITEKGVAKGVKLNDGTEIFSEYTVSTADSKVTLGKMVGYDIIAQKDAVYAQKAKDAPMSPSGFAIHLGLSEELNLKALGFDCGYNVLTTGRHTHEQMFDAWEKGNLLLSDDAFHMAAIAPSVMTGGRNNLIIHVVPVPADPWIPLRKENYSLYQEKKLEVADFYIRKVEEYMIPGLTQHILFTDVSTPATYARYIGSPSGSNYDMMPIPSNFGKNRLKTRTPIKNLFMPKFSHGIWPSFQAGLQVVDMISGGKIMKGNSSYSNVSNSDG